MPAIAVHAQLHCTGVSRLLTKFKLETIGHSVGLLPLLAMVYGLGFMLYQSRFTVLNFQKV